MNRGLANSSMGLPKYSISLDTFNDFFDHIFNYIVGGKFIMYT